MDKHWIPKGRVRKFKWIDTLLGNSSGVSVKTPGAKRYYSKRPICLLHEMVFCGFARPAAYLACDERT